MIQATKNLNLVQKMVCYQTAKDKHNQQNSIKFETKSINSDLCDYSDAFILVARDITVSSDNDADVTFKNCASFSPCRTEINHVFIDEENHIYIAMLLYNLIEYSHNCSDASGSLRQFKGEEVPSSNTDLNADNSESFRYKAALVGKTADAVNNTHNSVKNTKIFVPLKY